MEEKNKDTKRGWILDLVMAIGHQEAKLTHTDETICNLYEDMDNLDEKDAIEKLQAITKDLGATRDAAQISYLFRAMMCDDLFDELEESDRKKLCEVKHDAASFVLVAEKYHAQGFTPKGERLLIMAGKNLAMTCSRAFGLDPMGCLRCFNDAMNAKIGFDTNKAKLEES